MKYFTVILAATLLVSCTALPGGRIIGGEDAVEGEFPYQIMYLNLKDTLRATEMVCGRGCRNTNLRVSMRNLGLHTCGASIIGAEWIVTAGHCSGFLICRIPGVNRGFHDNLSLHFPGEQILLFHGKILAVDPDRHAFSSPDFATTFKVGTIKLILGGSTHKVVKKIVHPDYGTSATGAPINDIALYQVTPPIEIDNKNTKPIPLPESGVETPAGSIAVVTGWGSTQEGSVLLPLTLQKVSIPVITKEECENDYGGKVPENEICAAVPEGGKDSCQGDSGGPMAVNGVLHGIVSWGNGCGRKGYPGVYTEVSKFRDWIRQNTGI